METFGDRLRTLREELGVSQIALSKQTGLSQPRLSKVEMGVVPASADMVDAIAKALGREGLELARGTDREDHYRSVRLTVESRNLEMAAKVASEAGIVHALGLLYQRVLDLFDAMHGGIFVPGLAAEPFYITLREHCKRVADAVEAFHPGVADELFYPDHIEPDGQQDDILLFYEDYERPRLRAARRALMVIENQYREFLNDELRATVTETLPLGHIDKQIAYVSNTRKDADKEFPQWVESVKARLSQPLL